MQGEPDGRGGADFRNFPLCFYGGWRFAIFKFTHIQMWPWAASSARAIVAERGSARDTARKSSLNIDEFEILEFPTSKIW